MRSAEIGRGIVLPFLNAGTTNGAGTAEEIEQCVAISPTNGPLPGCEVLLKTMEQFQHAVLVRSAHDATPGRTDRCNASTDAETARRIFDHISPGHTFPLDCSSQNSKGDT